MINITPVILCGGSGTRLWPLSRSGFPKPFLCLTGDESLFQQTAKRLAGLGGEDISVGSPITVSREDHRFLVTEQLREVNLELGMALLEPVGRNTAPALTLAALAALEKGSDPVLAVTAADQIVVDTIAFTEAMQAAIREANTGSIVVLGVTPDKAETGYGYIQTLPRKSSALADISPSLVQAFVEKPNQETAKFYITQGNYYWNAGIFVLKASMWLKALEQFRPEMAQTACIAWARRTEDTSTSSLFVRPSKTEFSAIASESVDYAVMERCPNSEFALKMVPLDAGWSDIGAWDAVWNVLTKDRNGNAHHGDVVSSDSCNTLVYASNRLVSLLGVKDLIVVETADVVMVAEKSRSQEVKHIFSQLENTKRKEHTIHRKVHRPWGWYDVIDEGERFKVKRIHIKPKASLSLQKHHHRAEHWVVVKGTAEITCGDRVLSLTENQSISIPLGQVHRLANPSDISLELIEVQSGSFLDESDIVRFEDSYGRTNK